MKNYLKIFVVLVILLSLFNNFNFVEGAQLAPDFKLVNLEKNTVVLSTYRKLQQPVLLIFWTTWCPYCRDQLMEINDKYAQLTKNNLGLLAINVGESVGKVEKFVSLRNFSYEFLLDQDTNVARSFGIMGVPTYVLIDKDGYISTVGNSFPEKELEGLVNMRQ
ncbi:MAG: peroxiredoxin family protein [Candidatus Omnitrophota bacterium]